MDDLGGQTVTFVEKVYSGHGDYVDGERTVSPGWSVQPMTPEEQQRLGLQVTRRWKAFGPPTRRPARDELEVTGLVDEDAVTPLRLTLHGPLEVWPDEHGADHHAEGIFDLTEGSAN